MHSVDSIAYCCTVSGALRGPQKDAEFCQEMQQQWGIGTTSTMLACTEALHHMGMTRVVVTSPYPDSHHVAEQAYLEASGIQPLVMKGMGLHGGQAYGAVTPEEVYDFSLRAWEPYCDDADGLFVSCMNLDAMPAIEALEEAIGKSGGHLPLSDPLARPSRWPGTRRRLRATDACWLNAARSG